MLLIQILILTHLHLKKNKMNVFQLSPSVSTFIHSVPFQPDTDNRSNFSSDKAFHIFKKQRYISAFVHFIEVNCFKLQTQCCLLIDTVWNIIVG